MKLNIQQFGGRGGGSGGGGGGGSQSRGRGGGRGISSYGLPQTLDDDIFRPYTLNIVENNRTRQEPFYGTRWQIRERVMNFAESHNLTQEQYLRQTRYTIMPVQEDRVTYFNKSAEEIFTEKEALKEYKRQKKEFAKRYKETIRRR